MRFIARHTNNYHNLQQKESQPQFGKQGELLKEGNSLTAPVFNKSSQPSIQTKLTIGQPGDKYEREADAVADQVMNHLSAGSPPPSQNNTPAVQRKCAKCEPEEKLDKKEETHTLQRKPIFESDDDAHTPNVQTKLNSSPSLQEKCTECEKEESEEMTTLRQKPDAAAPTSTPHLESRLNSSKGSGQVLPDETRYDMEGAIGSDFSNVRVHTDSSAVQMNKELGAQAFTHGSDVYFGAGKYDTGSADGKRLLAHELVHTVQQGGGGQIKRRAFDSSTGEADSPNVYDLLRETIKKKDKEKVKTIIRTLNTGQKNVVLQSKEFMDLVTKKRTGGADFGDDSVAEIIKVFLEGGYQNLYWCLKWMFYEFDSDEDNNDHFIEVIKAHSDEEQKRVVRLSMKKDFIKHLWDKGMKEVVKLLGGPLDEKLRWLKHEDVTDWDIVYDVIIDHIAKNGHVSKLESENIYYDNGDSDDMRWYFGRKIDVGDYTMVRAIELLGFELYQKLDWMIYEDTNLSLVMHVIGSSSQEELEDVKGRDQLLKDLKSELGYWNYKEVLRILNKSSENNFNISPIDSPLDSTIDQELYIGDNKKSEDRLMKIGVFLLESVVDEYKMIENNEGIPQEYKKLWLGEIEYFLELLKMEQKFEEEEEYYENNRGREYNYASNFAGNNSPIQAKFIQAWVRPIPGIRGGGRLGPLSGARVGPKFTPRLAPPRIQPPNVTPPPPPPPTPFQPWTSASWRIPPQITRPGVSTSQAPRFQLPTSRTPWLVPVPQEEPSPNNPNVTWDKSDWIRETHDRMKGLRRQLENMRNWRKALNTEPQPQVEPDTDTTSESEEKENENRKRRLCYKLSIVMAFRGLRLLPISYTTTPDDLRIRACAERGRVGVSDMDFKKKNIAVGRFLVGDRIEYIEAPNPERNYHSEDEIFRLADERFGSGNYKIDALFTERRACPRCVSNIFLFPRTAEFKVYCIINNDYNWSKIREEYSNGVLY